MSNAHMNHSESYWDHHQFNEWKRWPIVLIKAWRWPASPRFFPTPLGIGTHDTAPTYSNYLSHYLSLWIGFEHGLALGQSSMLPTERDQIQLKDTLVSSPSNCLCSQWWWTDSRWDPWLICLRIFHGVPWSLSRHRFVVIKSTNIFD